MRFDDMLATVLAQAADRPDRQAARWRQLVDLLAQGRSEAAAGSGEAAAYAWLRVTSKFTVEVLRDGRNWCATVRQSHSNHPSLIYFQSVGTGAGWPAALGALLDLALLSEQCLDDSSLVGAAVLLRAEGTGMARELAGVIGLEPLSAQRDEPQLAQAAAQLKSSGYAIRPQVEFAVMAEQRAEYRACVEALADHLGKPTAPLVRQQ